jgi:acetoin utilization deacetylase AcuC-like enzyme
MVNPGRSLMIFYDEYQNVAVNESFSPSAGKPAKVLLSWKKLRLPLNVDSPEPLGLEEISLAHDRAYVFNVLSLKEQNGFGNKSEAIAKSLAWTTGSMLSAALHALHTGQNAVSLTSGFHHASYDRGGGYCTFNGLMVAAAYAIQNLEAKRVGIIDLDAHCGNGTADIIHQLELEGKVKHYTFGGDGVSKENAEAWLSRLPEIVRSFSDCDLVIYQAGADPWIFDSLGGVLTKSQLARRDAIVFNTCAEIRAPVAWNLAGGYAQKFQHVLDIHANTAIAALCSSGQFTEQEMTEFRSRGCLVDGTKPTE